MIYYGYDQFINDMKLIKPKLEDVGVDGIVFAVRGGATISHFLSEAMSLKSVYSINVHSYEHKQKVSVPAITNFPNIPSTHKCIAIIDEIVDSGETMALILEKFQNTYPEINFVTVSIFQKKSAVIQADIFVHYCDEWIEFFWEKDLLATDSTAV